eukprot:391590-Amphidinium_carterae.1
MDGQITPREEQLGAVQDSTSAAQVPAELSSPPGLGGTFSFERVMIRASSYNEHVERALRNLSGEERSEQEVLAQRTNRFRQEVDEISFRAQQDSVSNRTRARTFEWEAEELRVRLQWHEMELNMASQVVQAREQALSQ